MKITAALLVAGISLNLQAAPDIPELLKCADGTTVTTVQQRESQRRGVLLDLFRSHVYGRNPVDKPADLKFETLTPDQEMMGGKTLRKRIKVSFSGPGGSHSFVFTSFIPKLDKPVPAFLLICNREYENIDPARIEKSTFWPAEEIVNRGYAALVFRNAELDPDNFDGWTNGVHQHMLIALMAPRLVYVASASEDAWAGQPGEFQSCVLASPVWQLYGLQGLEQTTFPKPDSPIHKGCIGYHLRSGKHNLTEYDWKCYMDFADKHWR